MEIIRQYHAMHYSVSELVDGTCGWQLAFGWVEADACGYRCSLHTCSLLGMASTGGHALKQLLLDGRRLLWERTNSSSPCHFRSWLWNAELTGTLFPIYSSNKLVPLVELEPPESCPVDLALVKPHPTPWKTHSFKSSLPIQVVASKTGGIGSDAHPQSFQNCGS